MALYETNLQVCFEKVQIVFTSDCSELKSLEDGDLYIYTFLNSLDYLNVRLFSLPINLINFNNNH